MTDSNQSNIGNNRTIVKNTMVLYVSQAISMIVGVITSRVVLDLLGQVDYGLYNVVGGIVIMFAFINNAMHASTQRFINFELGKNNGNNLTKVFSTCVEIHFILAILVILLLETIGLWFFYHKLVIPLERVSAAFWVYQASIVTCFFQIIAVPYSAAIVAYEKMHIFTFFSVGGDFLKLLFLVVLAFVNHDKLIIYAGLMLLIAILNRIGQSLYCIIKLPGIKYIRSFDSRLVKKIATFSSWTFWGNLAYVIYTQGVNILLNLFFGPIVNTARAIAVQVQGLTNSLCSNFQTSVAPQITKNYAAQNNGRTNELIFASCRITYFLMLLIMIPIFFEVEFILKIWLKDYPEYTIIFVRIILLCSLIEVFSKPIATAAMATGNIKVYQLVVGSLNMAILPLSYIVLKMGGNPISVFIVQLIMSIIAQYYRISITSKLVGISRHLFFSKVLKYIFIVSLMATIPPLIVKVCLPQSIWASIFNIFFSILTTLTIAFNFGLQMSEKQAAYKFTLHLLKR